MSSTVSNDCKNPSTSNSNDKTELTDAKETLLSEFLSEVKEIEERDNVLTPKQQIDRLTRPGATYFNLNPFEVLQVHPDTPLEEIKQKYKRLLILVHPDKNLNDTDRAKKAFEAVNKAYKTLENEIGYKRSKEVISEAVLRVEEEVKSRRKQLKKEGKEPRVPEDDPDKFKHSVYVQTCKLFADLERLRQEKEMKEAHEKKRKAQDEEEEQVLKKAKAEWNKNYEESRTDRVESWRGWKQTSKKAKGSYKPPKPRAEKRN